jgi:PhoH-like ATPase
MSKVIIDTNALLEYGDEILKQYEHVIIPLLIVEEIDGLKKNADPHRAYKARQASKAIKAARNKNVEIKSIPYTATLPPELDINKTDNKILSIAKSLCKVDNTIKLITDDLNMLIKAEIENIPCDMYSKKDECYAGIKYVEMSDSVDVEDLINALNFSELVENQYVLFGKWVYNEEYDQKQFKTKIAYRYKNGYLDNVKTPRLGEKLNDCFRENSEQRLIYDAINTDGIDIIIVFGDAGTGKDYTTLANCINNVMQPSTNKKGTYKSKSVLYTRNIIEVAERLGFLPGDAEDKIAPYMSPARHNINKIFQIIGIDEDYEKLVKEKKYVEQPLAYIRGNTYDNCYLIFDEASNSTIDDLKAFISRAGDNSKVIILGSLNQKDNRNNSPTNNGLYKLIHSYRGQKNCAIIKLRNQQRSYLARQADELLD